MLSFNRFLLTAPKNLGSKQGKTITLHVAARNEMNDEPLNTLASFAPLLAAVIVIVAGLWVAHWFLLKRNEGLGNEKKFPRQILMLGLTIIGLVILILVLPVRDSVRNQLIGLIGLLLSGVIAFSSPTVVANIMAGIMLRITTPFRVGDFIRVGDYFGRVVERGLLDTEIQSENRELIALPNTYVISNPTTTIRSSGTVISVCLSLGYDIHHSIIESLLKEAAGRCGLEDPFVRILELGNYSVTYRVSALLSDIKILLTAQSQLFRAVLDTLHENNIEIMSPSFMNQRRLPDDRKIIPACNDLSSSTGEEAVRAEEVVFDKAEEAENLELKRQTLAENIQVLKERMKSAQAEELEQLKDKLEASTATIKALEQKSDGKSGNGKV